MDPGELALRVGEARAAGFQVAIHAIGDRAIDVSLDALEQHAPWDNSQGAWARPRLIHCEVMRPDLFPRMKRLGVVADLQPRFVSTDKRFAEHRLGPARAPLSYACRSFLEAGIPVAFGSDCPVEPIEPILGIFAAVTRCDTDGNPPGGWYPQEKISVEAALRCFTVGGAWAVGEEDEKGTITPGKLADLVVWDRDPLGVDPQELPHLRPVLVVVGGEVAYESDATSSGA
jgi:predicted amidohydrolase YtcJ